MKKYQIIKQNNDRIIFKSVTDQPIYFEDLDRSDIPFENYQEAEDYSNYGYVNDYTVIIIENADSDF